MQEEISKSACRGYFTIPRENANSKSFKRTKSSPRIRNCRDEDLLLTPPSTRNLSTRTVSHNDNSMIRSCFRPKSARCLISDGKCKSPLGSFQKLPTELIYEILDYMPVISISNFGQTSKKIRDILIRWADTIRLHGRLIPHFRQMTEDPSYPNVSPIMWVGNLSLPSSLYSQCHNIGILLKRLTCSFPAVQRLGLLKQIMESADKVAKKKVADYEPCMGTVATGVVLRVLILGWELHLYHQVYYILSHWFYLRTPLSKFLAKDQLSQESLKFLRLHLRALFLDFCAESDRSVWVSIVFNPKKRSNEQIAGLLNLLYAPICEITGEIFFDFFEEDVSDHPYSYKMYADTLGRLTKKTKTKHTSHDSLMMLLHVFATPDTWPEMAMAALILYLHAAESKLVYTYFQFLAVNRQISFTARLLSEIITVSSYFIVPHTCDRLLIGNFSVLSLILCALDVGWDSEDRDQVVSQMWALVHDASMTLLDDAMESGTSENVHALMDTWRGISYRLSYRI